MATIDQQLDALRSMSESALSSARTTASRIGTYDVNVQNPGLNYQFTDPNLQQPPQFSDLFPGTDTSDEQIQHLNDLAEDWIDQWFPEINACLKSKPEEWICNILSGDNEYGLNATVFEIVWQRARDRAYRGSATEQKTLQAQFSERGFQLPPGALVQVQVEAEQRAGQQIGEVNREQQIRESEIKLDLLKFAEEQAIRLKLGVMDAMATFYRMWFEAPDKDLQRAQIRAQAQATFYNSLAAYWNVELGFEQLKLRAAQIKSGIDLDVSKIKIDNLQDGRNGALGQAANGFADVAASTGAAGNALLVQTSTEG